ncbi:SDR family oxidoreductase [Streptomyces chrestomyceticus]|uniref:SDR family oxidoreductase n=1 Tax=Streptomyces chrestomyceticus TaxID=68185 RepID=UPI0019D222E0|nr:SDR family oxidoreductase [Streptomyces chrestomyceticus]
MTANHPPPAHVSGPAPDPVSAPAPGPAAAAGRVAVVTGGSRGIGRAVCLRLAQDGLAVVVNYAHDAAAAEETAAAVGAAGGRAIAVRADVADEDAVAALFERAEREFGGVDVVVNCAGRLALSPVADLDLAVLDAVHRTNIRGTFVVAQQAARRLRAGGAFVGFSTSVVGTRFPAYGAYAASKAAVEALTLILARELRGRDITVNTVAPGPTATDLFLEGKTPEQVDQLAKAPPLERLGAPEDIAQVVAFLSSPAGHWVNGQVLRANGGLV